MKLDRHYVDPRLVELYDIENSRGADTDFYLELANELGARRILDLGCGTGLLTRELATEGREVVGIDPSGPMLACARRPAGATRVTWIEGDASSLGTPDADLVIMTGNVAQIFLDDKLWLTTLQAIHAALRPGGYLAFESRNPAAKGWESWTRAETFEQFESPFGPMTCWLELTEVSAGKVAFEGHNIFESTGEILVAPSVLRFRTEAELTTSLVASGFSIEQLYGSWQRQPFTESSRFMVFVARRI